MNKDFYPTPQSLIRKMLEGVEINKSTNILEPSAGKGDIVDYIKSVYGEYRELAIDVIEIDEDLQAILKGKDYNLVFNNFIQFNTFKKYDLIVANFPFSEGDRHLKKALEIAENHGGNIVCLVNAETIKNPYTNLRKIVVEKLNKYNASIEYLQDQFLDAERKTGVEVALIRVSVTDNNKSFLILDNLKKSKETNIEEKIPNKLVEKDYIKAVIARFNVECELGIKLIKEWYALKPFINKQLNTDEYDRPLIELKIRDASDYNDDYINEYLKGVRHKYWNILFSYDAFISKYTSNIQEELNRKLEQLSECDFNLFNIQELEKELNNKLVSGVEEAIMKMFDEFSYKYVYHPECSKNVHYYNGWKTNKAHRINKKIILPIDGFSSYSHSKDKIDDYYIQRRIQDIIKVFNYLSGELVNVNDTVSHSISEANSICKFDKIPFHYLEATFYKKGTCHITFKDDNLLEKFNIYGSQRKGWLPPSYGKKVYSDMTEEEKEIVDGFQGKEKYQEILGNIDYYLVETNQLLLNAA